MPMLRCLPTKLTGLKMSQEMRQPQRQNRRKRRGFASSETEVFEKIAESLRQCKEVEDLNDDEIMELCILSMS